MSIRLCSKKKNIAADAHLPTLDDGVVGDRLHVASIVVKRQVPHPWVQVLDEPGLVDEDGMIQFAGSPVLFGDEPAAIQQLHKIILQNKQKLQQMQMTFNATVIKSAG